VELRAVVQEDFADTEEITARCITDANCKLLVADRATQRTTRNAPTVFRFKAKVSNRELAPTKIHFEAVAKSDPKMSDAIEITLPVQPPTVIRKESVAGPFTGPQFDAKKSMPENWKRGRGKLNATISTSPWLPKIAGGEAIGTLALFEGKGNPSPKAIKLQASGATLNGVKTPVLDGAIADFAVVAARTGSTGRDSDISLFLVDLKAGGVEAKSLTNVDPTRGQAELTFKNAKAEPLGAAGDGWSILTQVLDRAAVLLAFEQVGGSDRALEMGRDYALDRIAFGRPIGSFQAVKHILADMYVSATLARSNCYYGAWALSTNASELPEAAAAARISATQAFQHCAKNNIQVHGGMGFTWEFDCHMYYRRANATALSLGSLSYWEDALIDRMRKRNAA
jgi:hypothetical protein